MGDDGVRIAGADDRLARVVQRDEEPVRVEGVGSFALELAVTCTKRADVGGTAATLLDAVHRRRYPAAGTSRISSG
jgi:hypothetical protein